MFTCTYYNQYNAYQYALHLLFHFRNCVNMKIHQAANRVLDIYLVVIMNGVDPFLLFIEIEIIKNQKKLNFISY